MGSRLRAVDSNERRCPAKRVTWPERECQLAAGHEGPHQARGWYDNNPPITWRTGRER